VVRAGRRRRAGRHAVPAGVPEDAGRAETGAAEPREASHQLKHRSVERGRGSHNADLLSGRFACGGEHLLQAKAVVGTGGREYTVTELGAAQPGQDDSALTAAERFEQFHRDNPHVYRVLVQLAREWVRRTGRRKVGIAALFERARWELSIQSSETPKLNNDYRAYYARLIMRDEPDLADLFELRRSAADEALGLAA
jgi:hypothetical protein